MTLAAGAALGQKLVSKEASKEVFLPGKTTAGHYQIELECGACHASSFTSAEEIQAACVNCHGAELEEANDAHPKSKFTDPRNASRVEILDARECVTCHAEHLPEQTSAMGLTLPEDYCYHCHQEIFSERQSHEGLPFDSCADAGCHNFHDNRALYEDFLVEHGRDDWLLPRPVMATASAIVQKEAELLSAGDADLPSKSGEHVENWARSAHALAGVNCSGCHQGPEKSSSRIPVAKLETCGTCHEPALSGWLAGRHGMRVAQGLAPMTVREARAEMKPEAGHKALSCSSCHGDHGTERELARYEACVSCHDDEHTRAFDKSPHFQLLRLEREGKIAAGGGVSCASCHMPTSESGAGVVRVSHNQNANLRPNEKMVRTVCQNCHGVPFAIDALSDAELVRRNFSGRPSLHVKSVDSVSVKVVAA